jgi:hypothetical protein
MMIAGKDTGSLVNHLYSRAREPAEIKVGDGATVLSWTDRHAGTVISVTAKAIVVQEDTATRTDRDGPFTESQSYSYAPNPNGREWTFKRVPRGRAAGQWREGGVTDGQGVIFGHREEYRDPSF